MRKLNKILAKRIIERISRVLPHNVNITDVTGEIIASYKQEYIGKISSRAMHAVELEEPCIVYRDSEEDKKGIHFPIRFETQIVGVVEINGKPDEIMMIGQMVLMIAELILQNDAYHELAATKEMRLNDFFYEWTRRKEEAYDERFRYLAELFEVDLSVKRVAVIICMRRSRYSVLDQVRALLKAGDYLARQSVDEFLLLLKDSSSLEKQIDDIMAITPDFARCYIGLSERIVSKSVKQASRSREIAEALGYDGRKIHYSEVDMECMIADSVPTAEVLALMEVFQEQDKDEALRSTIAVYVRCGENQKDVCQRLFIHRNTLNYRLDKIEMLTGKNPRNARDLMTLYTAAVATKLNKHKDNYR